MIYLKYLTNTLWFKIIAGVIYIVFSFEILFRIFSPIPIIPRYVTGTPYGIRGNMPNMNYWHKSADFKINIRTNSKGIRADEEIPYDKPAGIKRILVLGDSFGMGYEANLEDTFLYRMQQNLEKDRKKVQIVNMSVSGHGNAEELITFQKEGIKYKPDLVLVCWHGGTDLDDNVRSNLYVFKNGSLERKSLTYLPGIEISDKLYKIPLFIPVSENSHIYNWIRDEAGRKIKIWLAEFRNFELKLKGSSHKIENSDKNADNYSEKLTIALLKKIDKECMKINARLIILDIPNQKKRFEFYSIFPESGYKFHIISPIELFHKNINKNELFVNEHSHFHFTPKANRLVGNALSEYILKNKLLE